MDDPMFNLVLALLAGVVTIAAPCTLPMLPILLGASVGQVGKIRPAMIAAGFVMSFSATALLLGAITRIFDFDPNSLRTGATVLLLGFGLLMIWPAPFEWLSIRLNGLQFLTIRQYLSVVFGALVTLLLVLAAWP